MYVQSCCFANLGQTCRIYLSFSRDPRNRASFLSANSPRICDRVCMVRCKLFAQVKKFVCSKICPQPCKRRLNLLHFWRPRCRRRRRLCLNSLCRMTDCCLQIFSPAEFFAFVLQLYRQAKNMKLMKVLLMLLKRVGLSKRVLMTTPDERGKS